jgi:YVTN family beta-propeller protein
VRSYTDWLLIAAVAAVMILPGITVLRFEAPVARGASLSDTATPMPSEDRHSGALPTEVEQSPRPDFEVGATLVTSNNSLLPGNVEVTTCNPYNVVYDSGRDEIFVDDCTVGGSGPPVQPTALWGISVASERVVTRSPVGYSPPSALAYDSGRGEIFVAGGDYGDYAVTVVNDTNGSVVAVLHVGGLPLSMAYDSGRGEVFVANLFSENVSIINDTSNSVTRTIPLGFYPLAVRYANASKEIFVSGSLTSANGSGTGVVRVISDASDAIVANLTVGTDPAAAAYDSGTNEVFVGNSGTGNLTVISAQTNLVIATVPIGAAPNFLGYDAARSEIFVASSPVVKTSDNLTVLSDINNSVVARAQLPPYSSDFAFDPKAGLYFVANWHAADVEVAADGNYSEVAAIILGATLTGVAYDPGRGQLFVSDEGSGTVLVVSQASNLVVARVPVGDDPERLAYDARTGEVFVANYGSDDVSVISDSNDAVIGTVALGVSPTAVACDPVDGRVFVTSPGSGQLVVISDSNLSVAARLSLEGHPSTLAYDNGTDQVFVDDGGNLSVINAATDVITARIPVPSTSGDVAYAPGSHHVFVADMGKSAVSVISDLTDSVTNAISSPTGLQAPWGVAVDTVSSELLVADSSTSRVSTFSTSALRWDGNVVVGESPSNFGIPTGVAFDPQTGAAYVADELAGVIWIFRPLASPVVFTAQGLPPHSTWQLTTGGYLPSNVTNVTSGDRGRISLEADAGLLPYSITPPPGYGVARVAGPTHPSQDSVLVSGATAVTVTFRPLETLTFSESGLAPGTPWGVEVTPAWIQGGPPAKNVTGTGSSLSVTVVGGPWKFQIAPIPTNYRSFPRHGSVHVGSGNVSREIAFRLVAEEVVLQELGLSPGDNWTVSVRGPMNLTSTEPAGTPIRFELTNGTYNLTVEPSSGKVPSVGNETLVIVAPHRGLGITVRYT